MKHKFAPIVQLEKGLVRGIVQQVDDSKIFLYQGLRYGKANRFEKPRPVEPWSGVYDATIARDNPPQLGFFDKPNNGYYSQTISEDCLLLNVWEPSKELSSPRSVMVYIYGGGYETGSIFKISFDARWFAHRGDVIVVTVNYRLGPFGFMFGDDRDAPANLGLHDLILALEWVQENIAKFGGNPKSVTLFGNSAGSGAASALLLSPLTRGLFQRVSLQSAPLRAMHKEKSLEIIKSIARILDCDNSDIRKVIQNLKAKSIEELLYATKSYKIKHFTLRFYVVYGDELLPDKTELLLASGKYNRDIDLMVGAVRDEGIFFGLDNLPELKDDELELTFKCTRKYVKKIVGEKHGDSAFDFYVKRCSLSEFSSQDDFRKLIFQVYGDWLIIAGLTLFGEQHAKHSAALGRKVFAWQLDQPASVHVVTMPPKYPGVYHADELFYLFTIPKQENVEDIKLGNGIIRAWTQFGKNGNPESVGSERWTQAVEGDDCSTRVMTLGYESKMVSGLHGEICEFWRDKLYE